MLTYRPLGYPGVLQQYLLILPCLCKLIWMYFYTYTNILPSVAHSLTLSLISFPNEAEKRKSGESSRLLIQHLWTAGRAASAMNYNQWWLSGLVMCSTALGSTWSDVSRTLTVCHEGQEEGETCKHTCVCFELLDFYQVSLHSWANFGLTFSC